jgi:heme/copper-type cytochrome/quinol oxidase subunit 2
MAATKVTHKSKNEEHEAPLKGTWISVTVVGVVIVATYIVLYGLYMARL